MIKHFVTAMSAILLVYILIPLQLHAKFQAATFEKNKVTNETLPHVKIKLEYEFGLTSCIRRCKDNCTGAMDLDGTCSLIGDKR